MEKVRLWCGQPSDRGRLKNRTEQSINQNSQIPRLCCQAIVHDILVVYGFQFYRCQPLVNGAASSYKSSYGQLTKHLIKLKLNLVKILVKRVVDNHLAKVVYMSPTSSGPTLGRPHCSRHAPVPILSVFPALTVHSELKSVHPGFPVAFLKHKLINK